MSRFLVIFLALAAGTASAQSPSPAEDDSPYEQMQILARAMQLIRQDYVDDSKISYKDLSYDAMRGMLSALDPHSQFMDPEEFKSMQEDTKSEFGGLGVVVGQRNGVFTVINPMEDSRASQRASSRGTRSSRSTGRRRTSSVSRRPWKSCAARSGRK